MGSDNDEDKDEELSIVEEDILEERAGNAELKFSLEWKSNYITGNFGRQVGNNDK